MDELVVIHILLGQQIIVNSQFSSVFTMDDGNLPDFSPRSRDNLSDINLSTERVRKFMCMLPNKYSRSPDGIPSQF